MSLPPRPAISVVMPLFNKQAYVRQAVESVLAQSLADFELIIVDDGSTDGSLDVVSPLTRDPRIRLKRQANAGEGAARNRGIAEAGADVIAFLDADDEFLPGHIAALLALAVAFPQAGLIATGYRVEYASGRRATARCGITRTGLIPYFDLLAKGFFPFNSSSVAVRRTVIARTGAFLAGEPLGADLEFYIRVALRSPVALDPAPSSIYRIGVAESAITAAKWRPVLPPAIRLLQHELAGGGLPENIRASARMYVCAAIMRYAAVGIVKGCRPEAIKLLSGARPTSAAARVRKSVLLMAAHTIPGRALSAYLSVRQRIAQ